MCILCSDSVLPASTTFLDCSGCAIVRDLPPNLDKLTFLIIYDTNIQTIPNYPSLEGLYMMNCSVINLPDLPKLRRLNATGSKLQSIPDTLYRLQTLLINNTPIAVLPETLISIQTISANGCTQLANISTKLINLESLSIESTSIKAVPALMSLQYIDMSNTAITELPLNQLPCLRKVFSHGCTLTDPFAIIDLGIDLTN